MLGSRVMNLFHSCTPEIIRPSISVIKITRVCRIYSIYIKTIISGWCKNRVKKINLIILGAQRSSEDKCLPADSLPHIRVSKEWLTIIQQVSE